MRRYLPGWDLVQNGPHGWAYARTMSDGVVLNIYISQYDVWEAGSATAVMNLLTRQATDAIAEWVKNREQGQSETTS